MLNAASAIIHTSSGLDCSVDVGGSYKMSLANTGMDEEIVIAYDHAH